MMRVSGLLSVSMAFDSFVLYLIRIHWYNFINSNNIHFQQILAIKFFHFEASASQKTVCICIFDIFIKLVWFLLMTSNNFLVEDMNIRFRFTSMEVDNKLTYFFEIPSLKHSHTALLLIDDKMLSGFLWLKFFQINTLQSESTINTSIKITSCTTPFLKILSCIWTHISW